MTSASGSLKPNTGPLAGVRVIDLSINVLGPLSTMVLGDMGADVVKVETPEGDPNRQNGPGRNANMAAMHLNMNRNKRSVTLNLKSDEGRKLFADLAAKSDVVVENFRPGLLDDMGIGYKALSERNPGLIYACISGFGSMDGFLGPYSKRPAYDIVAQAMGGLMNTCGQADGPPTWLGVALGDIVSGMNAAYAITLALYERNRTGRGQYIDISMYDTIIGLAERSVTAYSLTKHVLQRGREPYMAPWGPFECKDGYIGVIVATEGDWAKFCQAIDRPDLVGRDGATSGPDRAKSMSGWLGEIINGWFKTQTKAEATSRLLAAGLPIGPVQNAQEIYDDEQVAARRLMIDVPDPVLGTVKLVGPVAKLSGSPEPVTRPAPLLGEHNAEVLMEMLGYTKETVARLEEEGVIAMAKETSR
jgi:CoA:oxalate CoA-transferase